VEGFDHFTYLLQGDKADYSNYRGISLLSTTYTVLSNILLSMLTPNAGEIIGDRQCGFERHRSTTDHILFVMIQLMHLYVIKH
jgi:hypothetical protein